MIFLVQKYGDSHNKPPYKRDELKYLIAECQQARGMSNVV